MRRPTAARLRAWCSACGPHLPPARPHAAATLHVRALDNRPARPRRHHLRGEGPTNSTVQCRVAGQRTGRGGGCSCWPGPDSWRRRPGPDQPRRPPPRRGLGGGRRGRRRAKRTAAWTGRAVRPAHGAGHMGGDSRAPTASRLRAGVRLAPHPPGRRLWWRFVPCQGWEITPAAPAATTPYKGRGRQ
jgi:hypothetical protein